MTLRSLSRVFSIQDSETGIGNAISGGQEKRIRSSNSGKKITVPGHVSDFEFQNDRTFVGPDINKLTGKNANFNRFYIRRVQKRDVTHAAIPISDPRQHLIGR